MSTTHRSRRARLWALAGLVPLTLAACSSSGGGSTTQSDVSTAASNGASNTESSSGPALKIGLLMSVKGDDPYAINDYYQGAEVAISQINAAGGFHGQPVKSFRVPASQDPTKLGAQFLKLASMKPDIIVGAPPPAMSAISRQINQTAIPIVGTSSYPIIDGHTAGSKWMFMTLFSDANGYNADAKYAVQGLGTKSVAILHDDSSFGQAGGHAVVKDIPAAGGTIVTNQQFSQTATDLTGPLLAAKSAGAIVNLAYPGPQAAAINALAAQGKSTPTVGNGGITTSVTDGIIKKAALTHIFSTVPCNTEGTRPTTQKFLAAFKARFHSVPNYSSAQTYDAVYLALTAAKSAKSLSNTDLLSAIDGLDYTSGACASEYKTDDQGVMVHQVVIQGYKSDGTAVTKETYDFPPGS